MGWEDDEIIGSVATLAPPAKSKGLREELPTLGPPVPVQQTTAPAPTPAPAPQAPATPAPAPQPTPEPVAPQPQVPQPRKFTFEGKVYSFSPNYSDESIKRWVDKNLLGNRRKLTPQQAMGRSQPIDSDSHAQLRQQMELGKQGLDEWAQFMSGTDKDGKPVVVKPEQVTPQSMTEIVKLRRANAAKLAKDPQINPVALREYNEDTDSMERDSKRLFANETTQEHQERMGVENPQGTPSASTRDRAILDSRTPPEFKFFQWAAKRAKPWDMAKEPELYKGEVDTHLVRSEFETRFPGAKWTPELEKKFQRFANVYEAADVIAKSPTLGAAEYVATKVPKEDRDLVLAAVEEKARELKRVGKHGVGMRMVLGTLQGIEGIGDWMHSMVGGVDEETEQYKQKLASVREQSDPLVKTTDPFYAEWGLETARMVPQTALSIYAGHEIGLAAGLAGLSPAAAGTVGTVAAGATFVPPTYRDTYYSLRDEGIDPTTSKYTAAVSSLVQSSIEMIEPDPLFGKFVKPAKEFVRRTTMRVVSEAIKRFGKEWGEEVAQGVTDEVAKETARWIDGQTERKGFGQAIIEGVKQGWDAGGPVLFMTLPGGMRDVAMRKSDALNETVHYRNSTAQLNNSLATPEVVSAWVKENPELAATVAETGTPSRTQWEGEYGFPERSSAAQRKQFADNVRQKLGVELPTATEQTATTDTQSSQKGDGETATSESPVPPSPTATQSAGQAGSSVGEEETITLKPTIEQQVAERRDFLESLSDEYLTSVWESKVHPEAQRGQDRYDKIQMLLNRYEGDLLREEEYRNDPPEVTSVKPTIQEATNASTVRSTQNEVRQVEGSADIRGPGQDQVRSEPAGEVAAKGPQDQVQAVKPHPVDTYLSDISDDELTIRAKNWGIEATDRAGIVEALKADPELSNFVEDTLADEVAREPGDTVLKEIAATPLGKKVRETLNDVYKATGSGVVQVQRPSDPWAVEAENFAKRIAKKVGGKIPTVVWYAGAKQRTGHRGFAKDGVIYMNADTEGENIFWNTISHEVSHALGLDRGINLSEETIKAHSDEYLELYRSRFGEDAANKLASDPKQLKAEATALYIGKLFQDPEFRAQLQESDPSLWQRIVEVVRKLFERAGLMQTTNPDIAKVRNAFFGTVGTEKGTRSGMVSSLLTTSDQVSDQVMFTVKSYLEGTWTEQFRTTAAEKGWSKQVIDSSLGVIQSVVDIFQANSDVLPQEGTVHPTSGKLIPALVSNADFKYTLDPTRLCKRVMQYWATVKKIESSIDRVMTEDELLALGQEMRADGDIPGCIFCYVEASRRAARRNASAFTEPKEKIFETDARKGGKPRDALRAALPARDMLLKELGWSLDDLASFIVNEQAVIETLNKGRSAIDEARTSKLRKIKDRVYRELKIGKENNKSWEARPKSPEVKSAQNAARAAADKKVQKEFSAALAKVDAKALKDAGPKAQLIRLYNDYVLSAKGTAMTPLGTYMGEILTKEDILESNERAGLRWLSTTDLDPTQLVDTMQAMADATVMGVMGHEYTKEPYAVLIFGNTGMKQNLSIAFDGRENFTPDVVNGMPLDVALELQKRYANTGTMAVAKNMEQLDYTMNHPDVRMIIPHHAANWSGGPAKYGIFDLDDFSKVQHERWADNATIPKKDGKNLSPSEVFGKKLLFAHWLKQEGTDQGAVRAYLKFCEDNQLIPKFAAGKYMSGKTGKSEDFLGYTSHPEYARLLKDYARTDSPQEPLNVHAVNQERMHEYLRKFVEGGGWQSRETPNPKTVKRMTNLLKSGKELDLRAREQQVVQLDAKFRLLDTLESLGLESSESATTQISDANPRRKAKTAATGERKRSSRKSQVDASFSLRPGQSKLDALDEFIRQRNERRAAAPKIGTTDLTSIKKAVIDDLRQMAGLPAMKAVTPQTVQDWADAAERVLRDDPLAADRLLTELNTKPRALNEIEVMVLQYKYRSLANELEPYQLAYFEAVKSQDNERIAMEARNLQLARGQMSYFEATVRPSGTTWGRAGRAMQEMLKKDFSREVLLRRAQEWNNGQPLDAKQTAEMEQMAAKIKAVEAKLATVEAENEVLRAEKASQAQHEAAVTEGKATRSRKKSEQRVAVEKKISDAWGELKKAFGLPADKGNVSYSLKKGETGTNVDYSVAPEEQSQLGPAIKVASAYIESGVTHFPEFFAQVRKQLGDQASERLFRKAWDTARESLQVPAIELDMEDLAELTREARKIQRTLVENGITDRETVIDTVHESMKEFMPEFSRRQAMDALAAYGQFSLPSQEETAKKIRHMNAEILKLSQIDQLEKAIQMVEKWRSEGMTEQDIGDRLQSEGLFVKPTGPQRDAPTDTVRELTAQYNELKKSVPAPSEKRAGQLSTAQGAIERFLLNRLRDVRAEIDADERIVKTKRTTPDTTKSRMLRAELDALMKIHKEHFPPRPMTPEQRLAASEKAAQRLLAYMQEQEKAGFPIPEPEAPPLTSAALEETKAKIAELRAKRDADQKEGKRVSALDKQIAELQARLQPGGNIAPKASRTVYTTPMIEERIARRRELQATLEARRDAEMPELKEARSRKTYEANLNRRIAALQRTLAEGDFAPKPKKEPRVLSPNEQKLKLELEQLKGEVWQKMAEYHIAHLKGLAWTGDKIRELSHLSRAIWTSFDFSALGRQGGLVAISHPKFAKNALWGTIKSIAETYDSDAAKALLKMEKPTLADIKKFLSTIDTELAEFNFHEQLKSGPDGEFRVRSGLSLTSSQEAARNQEELMQGRWAKYVPGVSLSGHLYSMILNKLRADLFDSLVANLARNSEVTVEEGKVIADFVNVTTGRGGWKKLQSHTATLNMVFFASRWAISRFQYLAMPLYLPFKGGVKANWRVKAEIYKEMSRTMGALGSVLGAVALIAALGYDDDDTNKPTIELDPRSSDFLKIRIGETRYDFTAGLSQAAVFIARNLAQSSKSSITGKVKKFGEGYPAESTYTQILKFGRGKLAPVPGNVATILDNWEDPVGNKQTPLGMATGLFMPLTFRDMWTGMQSQGIPKELFDRFIGMSGAGVNTYGPRTKFLQATPEEQQKLFDKDLEQMEWDTPNPPYSDLLTPQQMDEVAKRRVEVTENLVYQAAEPVPDRSHYQSEASYQSAVKQHDAAVEQFKVMAQTVPQDIARQMLIRHYTRPAPGKSVGRKIEMDSTFPRRAANLNQLYGE